MGSCEWVCDEQGQHYASWPTTRITSEAQLRELLERYRFRHPPSELCLGGPIDEALYIGIGPDLSGLRWVKQSWDRNYKIAINRHPLVESFREFCDQGDIGGTTFDPEHLLPTERVIEAAVQFFRTQHRPDSVEWEPIISEELPLDGP